MVDSLKFSPSLAKQAAPRLYRIVRMISMQSVIEACKAEDLDFLDMLAEYLDDEPFTQRVEHASN